MIVVLGGVWFRRGGNLVSGMGVRSPRKCGRFSKGVVGSSAKWLISPTGMDQSSKKYSTVVTTLTFLM